jgi:tetratricopeptide (TPR) repeat protein
VTVHNEAGGRLSGSIVQAGSIHHVSLTNSPPAPIVPRQLPLAIRDFVGRAEHLAALDALLPAEEAGTVVISALDGTGGVGKTTLAIHWAHRVQDRFPDGTLYVNLRGYGPGEPATPTEVLDAFLRALGCPSEVIPIGLEAQSGLYRSLLAGRRILIVLDNAKAADQVRPLLPASAGCLALITSRSSLTGLVVSESAIRVTLDLLTPPEAVDLVRGIIGTNRADAEPEAVVELTQLCARLPLALRIAAHRAARIQSPIADLVTELSDIQTRLDHLTVPDDELATVRTVLSWSDRALPADQSRMFRLLGLHPGTHISAHAAAALADISPPEARRLLDSLANVHLLDHTFNDRYTFHDLLRAYASEQAYQGETTGDRYSATYRLLGWYLHACDTIYRNVGYSIRPELYAAPPPRHPLEIVTQPQALQWQEDELPNILAMVRYAVDTNMHSLAWQLMAGASIRHLVPLGDQIDLYHTGLNGTRELKDRYGEFWMLEVLGSVHDLRGDFTESIDAFEQALVISKELGVRLYEAETLNGIGNGLRGLGHLAEAIDFHQKALAIFQEEDRWTIGVSLLNLGADHRQLGQFDQAIKYYQQAEEIFISTGDQFRLSGVWEGRAAMALALGRYREAIELYSGAMDVWRTHNYRYYEIGALTGLGVAWHGLGERVQARQCWGQAVSVCHELQDPRVNEILAVIERLED